MIPIYSVFPLEPNVRDFMKSRLQEPELRQGAPLESAAFKQHWVVTLVEGACVLANTYTDNSSQLRVKRIEYNSRTAYLLKASATRSRVVMYAAEGLIYVIASRLPPPDPNTPYFPAYPREGMEGCEQSTWSMSNYLNLSELSSYIAKYMTTPTAYSTPDYPRKRVSTKGISAYWYGTILKVEEGDTHKLWKVTVKNKDCERELQIYKDALRVKTLKLGYLLIYSDSKHADVVRSEDLHAFYVDVSGTADE